MKGKRELISPEELEYVTGGTGAESEIENHSPEDENERQKEEDLLMEALDVKEIQLEA